MRFVQMFALLFLFVAAFFVGSSCARHEQPPVAAATVHALD